MRRIHCNSRQLNTLISECVKRALNEISNDTVYSAAQKAYQKFLEYRDKYGENDPETKKYWNQYHKFNRHYQQEYNLANDAKKARMLKNRRAMDNDGDEGEKRGYVPRIGWRNHK